MDLKLLGWARAVKARRAKVSRGKSGCGHPEQPVIPPLWLFTDAVRVPDPLPAVARLPRGMAGVVFRHDSVPARAELGRRLARLCRERRLVLVVAGDSRLAAQLGAGVHLRAGRWPDAQRTGGPVTSSAHGRADLMRALRAGADACFLSPVFPTSSHPGGSTLGAARWSGLSLLVIKHAGPVTLALGGIDGDTARRLPRRGCAGAGAIRALDGGCGG